MRRPDLLTGMFLILLSFAAVSLAVCSGVTVVVEERDAP